MLIALMCALDLMLSTLTMCTGLGIKCFDHSVGLNVKFFDYSIGVHGNYVDQQVFESLFKGTGCSYFKTKEETWRGACGPWTLPPRHALLLHAFAYLF
jgi:hypothetical protein